MTLTVVAAVVALFSLTADNPAYSEDDYLFAFGINSSADPVQRPADFFQTAFDTASGQQVSLYSDTSYSVSAKVESITPYNDVMGETIPYDLLLSWGRLTENAIDSGLTWEQDDRRGTVSGSLSGASNGINADYVISHVSNSHVIAANKSIAAAFDTIEPGDIVRIDGRLADVRMVDGSQVITVSSSRSRTDQGDGACEIIYVERIKINGETWS